MQAATTVIQPDGSVAIVTLRNDGSIGGIIIPKHTPVKRERAFKLSEAQLELLDKAIDTPRGKKLLNHLKNVKTDSIINEFTKETLSPLSPQPDKEHERCKKNYNSFLKSFIETPLEGWNHKKSSSIGLTIKQIWDAFVSEGLIIHTLLARVPNNLKL